MSVAFSSDGRTLAVGGANKAPILWDLPSGAAKLALPEAGTVLGFAPHGQTLAYRVGENKIRLWDVARSKVLPLAIEAAGSVTASAFSPDGTNLAIANSDHTIALWSTQTGKLTGSPGV